MKELKDSRDKLVHQDQAAKNAIQQMQREIAYRLEQVRGHRHGVSPNKALHKNLAKLFLNGFQSVLIVPKHL